MTDNSAELIPGFGDGGARRPPAGGGAAIATTIGAGKMALMAIKAGLAIVAATGVIAVGHERHLDSKALQAVGIEQSHHNGRGADDRGADDHGGARGDAGHSGRGGEAEPGDDRGGGHGRDDARGSGSNRHGGGSQRQVRRRKRDVRVFGQRQLGQLGQFGQFGQLRQLRSVRAAPAARANRTEATASRVSRKRAGTAPA